MPNVFYGINTVLTVVGMLVGLQTTNQPGYTGSGERMAAFSLIAISGMISVEVALSGQANHPFLFAPVFFLLGLALLVPIRPKIFAGIGLAIAALPVPLFAAGILPMTLEGAGIYEMFAIPTATRTPAPTPTIAASML